MLENKNYSMEYLISRHLLKKLLGDGLITEDEFNKIDDENIKTFNK